MTVSMKVLTKNLERTNAIIMEFWTPLLDSVFLETRNYYYMYVRKRTALFVFTFNNADSFKPL